MAEKHTATPDEERSAPRVDEKETGILGSPWFWRALWALIGGLMLLLIVYEFVGLG